MVCTRSATHHQTVNAQDFDRRRVPTRGLDDVLVSDELKGKLDKVRPPGLSPCQQHEVVHLNTHGRLILLLVPLGHLR